MKPYQRFCSADRGVLHITGGPGSGKSVMAASILQRLGTHFKDTPSTFVAYFAFDKDNEKLRLVSDMLSCCAAQVAQQDMGYRESIKDKTSAYGRNKEGDRDYWGDLFGSEFDSGRDHPRKLFLVVDGADQLDEEQSFRLMGYIGQARNDRLQMSLVVTGWSGISEATTSPEFRGPGEEELLIRPSTQSKQGLWELQLEKEKLRKLPDFGLVAAAHLENFNNLSRLEAQAKKTIVNKIREKADSK